MRRLILLLSALLLLGARRARQGRARQDPAPERLRARRDRDREGNTFYVGSVGSGAVYVGDLRTGEGRILVPGDPGVRSATGLELEGDRLWVAGARFGNTYIYNAKTACAAAAAPARDWPRSDVHQRRRRHPPWCFLHRLAAPWSSTRSGCRPVGDDDSALR